jgi:hypothetical protein
VLSLTLGSVEEGWASEGGFGRVELSDALLLEEGLEAFAFNRSESKRGQDICK